MDGKQGKTEESANDDEKASDTEDENNTDSNTEEKDRENGKEIKTPCGQDPKRQEMDRELLLSEAAAKENTTEENANIEEKDM